MEFLMHEKIFLFYDNTKSFGGKVLTLSNILILHPIYTQEIFKTFPETEF